MDTVRVELTEIRKYTIVSFLKAWEDVEDKGAEDWGIKSGLGWVVRKLQIEELIRQSGETEILVPVEVIRECREEWRTNSINAYWNLGYSRAIYSVFSTLGLKLRHDEEAIECIFDYYNK